MIKTVWLTDIHLNFLPPEKRIGFYSKIIEKNPKSILITGDIGEANNVCELLEEIHYHIKKPIYFVLGNHDYYRGSVLEVRENIIKLCEKNPSLHWLGKPEVITLNSHTLLVGHDGWADARYGDFDHSHVNLNDSRFIMELYQAYLLNKTELKKQMMLLADMDAEALHKTLEFAAGYNPKKIIIATHVPPFPENSWYKDNPSDANWLPYFSSKATGDIISYIAKKYPNINFLVLCGHTHTRNTTQLYPNLQIKTGGAEYYVPEIEGYIEGL